MGGVGDTGVRGQVVSSVSLRNVYDPSSVVRRRVVRDCRGVKWVVFSVRVCYRILQDLVPKE